MMSFSTALTVDRMSIRLRSAQFKTEGEYVPMPRRKSCLVASLVILYGLMASITSVHAHRSPNLLAENPPQAPTYPAVSASAPGISGQGKLRFKLLYTSDLLPEAARKVLISAHGGFAVDHRGGKEETYFLLPGAGILQISADMKKVQLLETAARHEESQSA